MALPVAASAEGGMTKPRTLPAMAMSVTQNNDGMTASSHHTGQRGQQLAVMRHPSGTERLRRGRLVLASGV